MTSPLDPSAALHQAEDVLWRIIRDQRAGGRKITRERIEQDIRSLEPAQAEILDLVFLQGLSVNAAAKRLGIHHKSAQNRLARARVNLAAALGLE